MRKLGECEDAVSPVIGVILLLGLTVILVSITAISVFAFKLPENAPHAKIVVVEAKGDLDTDTALYKNTIVLKHKGGDALFENNTGIIITGKGYAYNTGSYPSPAPSAQDIRVIYTNLAGENYVEAYDCKIVDGTSWEAGETITLYGSDGVAPFGFHHNTVDNKWKLDDGTTVLVTIIDTTTNEVIAVTHATVKDA